MEQTQALQIFNFQQTIQLPIRTILQNSEPWFVAADVCKVLSINDVSQALERLDDDERGGCIIPTPGGNQTMNCVNEPGLYHLIFQSRKEEAKAFRRWIYHEVLPSIRKTGSYSLPRLHLPPRKKPAQDEIILQCFHEREEANCDPEGITAREIARYRVGILVPDIRAWFNSQIEQGKIQAIKTHHTIKYHSVKPGNLIVDEKQKEAVDGQSAVANH